CPSHSDYNNVQILPDLESFDEPRNFVAVEMRSFAEAEDLVEIDVGAKNLVEVKGFVGVRDLGEEGVLGKKGVVGIEGLESFVGAGGLESLVGVGGLLR
ncbi:9005_t:CDS:1, partial [Cetraspora pellucida]